MHLVKFVPLGSILFLFCSCQSPLNPIAQSHIEANVPDKENFDRLLLSAITEHLSVASKSEVHDVQYQLLRDAPTQTGIGYPKYYLWARALDGKNRLVTEGALRVAAIDRVAFRVTDFLSKETIIAEPERVQKVFPTTLNERVLGLAGVKAKSSVR